MVIPRFSVPAGSADGIYQVAAQFLQVLRQGYQFLGRDLANHLVGFPVDHLDDQLILVVALELDRIEPVLGDRLNLADQFLGLDLFLLFGGNLPGRCILTALPAVGGAFRRELDAGGIPGDALSLNIQCSSPQWWWVTVMVRRPAHAPVYGAKVNEND
jgi:hypothetical protein